MIIDQRWSSHSRISPVARLCHVPTLGLSKCLACVEWSWMRLDITQPSYCIRLHSLSTSLSYFQNSSFGLMSQLPQELIDKIIDAVAAKSVGDGLWPGADLMPSSLVSRAFRPRCLIYIFSTVKIRDGLHETRKRRITELSSIIEKNPHFARHVEELTMEFGILDGALLIIEQVFFDVMEKISPLRAFTLASKTIMDLRNPLLLMDNVLPFIASSITSLKIQCLKQVPVEVITSCVHLSSLAVSFASLKGQGEIQSSTTPSLQLKHFSYQDSRIALDILLRPSSCVDLSHLQTLNVYTDKWSFTRVQDLLNLCSNSLEEFSLLSVGDSACESI